MPKFVVYEIWTRSRVVEAKNESDAYDKGEPLPEVGLSLSNWHVHPVDDTPYVLPTSGGLNYAQKESN